MGVLGEVSGWPGGARGWRSWARPRRPDRGCWRLGTNVPGRWSPPVGERGGAGGPEWIAGLLLGRLRLFYFVLCLFFFLFPFSLFLYLFFYIFCFMNQNSKFIKLQILSNSTLSIRFSTFLNFQTSNSNDFINAYLFQLNGKR